MNRDFRCAVCNHGRPEHVGWAYECGVDGCFCPGFIPKRPTILARIRRLFGFDSES